MISKHSCMIRHLNSSPFLFIFILRKLNFIKSILWHDASLQFSSPSLQRAITPSPVNDLDNVILQLYITVFHVNDNNKIYLNIARFFLLNSKPADAICIVFPPQNMFHLTPSHISNDAYIHVKLYFYVTTNHKCLHYDVTY